MKMENPSLEVVHFNSEDVIATSGGTGLPSRLFVQNTSGTTLNFVYGINPVDNFVAVGDMVYSISVGGKKPAGTVTYTAGSWKSDENANLQNKTAEYLTEAKRYTGNSANNVATWLSGTGYSVKTANDGLWRILNEDGTWSIWSTQ